MPQPRITSIVEGYGEVSALPVLMRRIAEAEGFYPLVDKPHRVRRTDFVGDGIAKAYRLQRARAGNEGIVVMVCDADDDRPESIEASIRERTRDLESGPVAVGIAVREFEAWFLAALPSLRSHPSIDPRAERIEHPETPRNAKKVLEKHMTESYSETIHQAGFCARMDLTEARAASPSFDRFVRQLVAALGAAGHGTGTGRE